jgi:hypothetical protein
MLFELQRVPSDVITFAAFLADQERIGDADRMGSLIEPVISYSDGPVR